MYRYVIISISRLSLLTQILHVHTLLVVFSRTRVRHERWTRQQLLYSLCACPSIVTNRRPMEISRVVYSRAAMHTVRQIQFSTRQSSWFPCYFSSFPLPPTPIHGGYLANATILFRVNRRTKPVSAHERIVRSCTRVRTANRKSST